MAQEKPKGFTDSFIFNMLNADKRITTAFNNSLRTNDGGIVFGYDPTKDAPPIIEEALLQIRKSFKYLLTDAILRALKEGRIVLAYNPKVMPTPQAPFFVINDNGKPRAVVLIHSHAKVENKGAHKGAEHVVIDAKKLYAMLEGAYIALCYSSSPKHFKSNTDLRTLGCEIYGNMMLRVLNRKYSINNDRVKSQKIQFLANKFYLVNVLGMDAASDMTKSYASKPIMNYNPQIIDGLHSMTDDSVRDFKDISNFVDLLNDKDLNLGLGDGFKTRTLISEYVMMFDGTILLGLELLPYYLYNIFGAVQGAYINNQYALDTIIDKDGVKLHHSVSRFIHAWD